MAASKKRWITSSRPLLILMAIMWVIVEMMNERNVFGGLNAFLLRRGLRSRGLFWRAASSPHFCQSNSQCQCQCQRLMSGFISSTAYI